MNEIQEENGQFRLKECPPSLTIEYTDLIRASIDNTGNHIRSVYWTQKDAFISYSNKVLKVRGAVFCEYGNEEGGDYFGIQEFPDLGGIFFHHNEVEFADEEGQAQKTVHVSFHTNGAARAPWEGELGISFS
jgi:hypothetical protein